LTPLVAVNVKIFKQHSPTKPIRNLSPVLPLLILTPLVMEILGGILAQALSIMNVLALEIVKMVLCLSQ